MTNEQINRLASELLGECWHDEGDPNNVAAHKRCSKCHHLAYDSFTDGVNPDYCTDRNAVARLVEAVDGWRFYEAILDLFWTAVRKRSGDINTSIAAWAYPNPKSTALACLVAAGKITMDEARRDAGL